MNGLIKSLPNRPLTREEVKQIEDQDRVVYLENVLGVRVTDVGDRYHVEAGFDTQEGLNLDFYLDLIIETESSIGIAAYPKIEFPPPEEAENQSVIETISAPDGEWTWISKGKKSDYRIEHGLKQLEEYRNFDPDAQQAYKKLSDIGGIHILERDRDKDNSLIESLFSRFRENG